MSGEENPWIVVITGVETNLEYVSGKKSKLLWITSKSDARSKTSEMWRHSATFGSILGSSDYPRPTTLRKRAEVSESPVAKRVTSWPRETSPSVKSEAKSSHGP